MRQLARLIVLLTTLGAALTGLTVPSYAVVDRDCSDFDTQRQAQNFFINQGGPRQDPHRLDADGDGRACDSLPCPCGATPKPPSGTNGKPVVRQWAIVRKVIDGDTVRVRIKPGRKVKTVRLLGIDSPEVYGTRECWGPQASASLKRLLPVGTRVRLVSDRSQARVDRYGRILRYVTKGKLNVNRRQVFSGSARVFVYNNKPFAQVKSYRQAQTSAKNAGRGLWGACS